MAAQFAAEATLRRVHAAQKDDDMPPIEAILAPLEAELKLARQEVCLSNVFRHCGSISKIESPALKVLLSSFNDDLSHFLTDSKTSR